MNKSKKLISNMFALSMKIIFTCIVQLIGTRIALLSLGDNGFGLYNLLAGIIILFTFLTGSLLISTQRFLSIAIGERNDENLKSIFNVSFLIHLIFSLLILILLFTLKSFLFSEVMNIDESLMDVAKVMYNIIAYSTSFTILSIPYAALMNAHEDMVIFAIFEMISLSIKLFAAVSLKFVKSDLLLTYTILMGTAVLVGAVLKYVWCRIRYNESKIQVALMSNIPLFKELFSFVSWNALGSVAVVIRNQGVAVLLNSFFGTTINAAYGVANQLNSLVLSFATTLTTVFTPSIVQSKGEGNNDKMLNIATFSSKLSFYISSLVAIPVLVYLEEILFLWLKDVPPHTNRFVFWIVLSFLIQQLYPGINRAIYAVGNIRAYQVTTSIILISIIPVGYLLLKNGFNVDWIIITLFILQIIVLLSTLYYAKKECNLGLKNYIINSVVKPITLFSIVCLLLKYFDIIVYAVTIENILVGIPILAVVSILYSVLYFKIVLTVSEQCQLTLLFKYFYSKVKIDIAK